MCLDLNQKGKKWTGLKKRKWGQKAEAETMAGEQWEGDGGLEKREQDEQKWERAMTISGLKMILLPLIMIRVSILCCECLE